jgi:hypothetical protein
MGAGCSSKPLDRGVPSCGRRFRSAARAGDLAESPARAPISCKSGRVGYAGGGESPVVGGEYRPPRFPQVHDGGDESSIAHDRSQGGSWVAGFTGLRHPSEAGVGDGGFLRGDALAGRRGVRAGPASRPQLLVPHLPGGCAANTMTSLCRIVLWPLLGRGRRRGTSSIVVGYRPKPRVRVSARTAIRWSAR